MIKKPSIDNRTLSSSASRKDNDKVQKISTGKIPKKIGP